MLFRKKLEELQRWKKKDNRKPLIIRGARQVGKTTLVNLFSKNFEQYIYLNLDRPEDKNLFSKGENFEKIVQSIFLLHSKTIGKKSTLIFIDEIQNSAEAIKLLRYFKEDYPSIFVIAAGSLLESLLDFKESFPVGRVEFLHLNPFTFEEYLIAQDKRGLADSMNEIPLNQSLVEAMKNEFSTFALIGGMPEIVNNYISKRDVVGLNNIFESLLLSYFDDIQKYAKNKDWSQILRHVLQTSFIVAGKRITLDGFGKSNYKTREVKESFFLLEKAMLLKLLYPTSSVEPPLVQNFNRSPKVQVLDTGLMNYFAGIQKEFAYKKNLGDVYSGLVTEHICAQELIANSISQFQTITFWLRENHKSSAEVDFVYQFQNYLIPVEIKSGSSGRLRSLMQFIERAPHNMAVRFYSGDFDLQEIQTPSGKKIFLLNLPFFLIGKLELYLHWLRKKSSN